MNPTEKKSQSILAMTALIIIAAFLATGSPAFTQEAEVTITQPGPMFGPDALGQALGEAESIFNDGLTTMNEDSLRHAAAQYEQIIRNFPNDARHYNAYFASAYINMEYLQSTTDYEHARNLLNLLITSFPSSYPEVTDAHVVLAHLEYRCLRNYRSAQEHLSEILNQSMLAKELGAREIEIKLLLAKCRQKLGEYEQAQAIWEELTYTNPELDTEGRLDWIQDSNNWFLIDDGRVRLFFKDGVDRDTYTSCLAGIREGLSMAEATWRLLPGGPVDVYLYSSSDHLFDLTSRSDGFTLPGDAEIYMSPSDMDRIGHLTGWLVSRSLNIRPDATVFPVLRAGFNHYFMGPRDEIDMLAAREIYYYGGTMADDEILFPLSFDYTYSDEYAAMSASFMHYLIDDGRLSPDGLKDFYRLLWANPSAMWQPPLMAEIMRLNPPGQLANWQDNLIAPAQLYDLFQNKLGVDLAGELASWQENLSDEIELVRAELGGLTEEIQRVEVDLSTPESALESWWHAYQAGDFNAMIESSTSEMARFLRDARAYYEEEGILEMVILDNFIRPYRSAEMVVVNSGYFAEDLYVFEVQIIKGDEIEEMTIVVKREDADWKIDPN